MRTTESTEDLIGSRDDLRKSRQSLESLKENILTATEKTFLLHAERGDCATVRRLIKEYKDKPEELDINCVDPLDRSALISAIENENIDLIKLLLEENIKVKDALLHAIKEEYVEAVELLLEWEEQHHVSGQPYSWEAVDRSSSTFTPDITPLILAAHKNNYEIIKLLLDRGATLPMPHDVKCGCDECVVSSEDDSLRHSQARINAYRALSSSSLIALSSKDPLLTAFELSWELRRLSRMETEFRVEYNEMRTQTQNFATSLLDHARTSHELEIMLNFNQNGDHWEPGERQTLERLKLAIKYKQKMFVAHPNVQQLLAAIWYDGLPGFRRKTMVGQLLQVAQLAAMFPVYSSIYMIAPTSNMGKLIKKPFVKFICHSASYAFFLSLLGLASQRAEILVLEWFGTPWMRAIVEDWKIKERGAGPGFAECGCILYVISLIWGEVRSLWTGGLAEYIEDLWNIVDCCTNFFFMSWITLRMYSWYTVQRDVSIGKNPWYPREKWDPYDPMLLSEGAFAAGMIFSFLKLVHIFSVNPHLGPLQISLGRMIIDIIKFFFIYTLVLSAFGCGLNQLLWYYANIEKNKCYHTPDGLPDFENFDKACEIWRRYANLFETSQTLFWASFGLVDLMNFELTGIKEFTRFWALLMFGSYSVINIIVLLNMLIAMMSNSYQIISERADSEWKFARSNLWMSYFEEGDTLPAPFNIMPTPKIMMKCFGIRKKKEKSKSFMDKSREKSEERHSAVMRLLIKRYVTAEQRKRDEFGITEDDVMEIRQDISSLRYELIDILAQNGMRTPKINQQDTQIPGKKGKVMERRLLKDFQIGTVEGIKNIINFEKESKDVFTQLAKVIGKRTTSNSKKDWNALVRQNTVAKDPIGSTSQSRQSLRKHIINASDVNLTEIDHNKLLEYNPKLSDVTLTTRLAYAKFMTPKLKHDYNVDAKADGVSLKSDKQGVSATKDATANSVSTSPSVSIKEPKASKISDNQAIINERNLSAAPSVKRPPSPIMEEPPPVEVKIENETTSKSSSPDGKSSKSSPTQTESPISQCKSPPPDMESSISEPKSQTPQSTILIPEIKSPPSQSKTHIPETEGSISDSKSPVPESKSSVSESTSKDDSENKAAMSTIPTCTVTIEAPSPIKKDGKSKVSGLPRVGWL